MTSKEKIVEIINKYLWKFDVDKLADELFEEFEKDLEVLVILSKYVSIKLQEQDGYYFLQINNESIKSITKEEYKILKEWLYNE